MAHDDERVLSEAEARRLWQRAAELQAEAAQRLEARSRALARSDQDDAPDGYSLTHVRQAAREAGISEEFVELALAEDSEGDAALTAADRWADRFLGVGPRSLATSRTYEHPAAEVYAALQRLVPRYRLALVDARGRDPKDGGVLVFDLPSLSGMEASDTIIKDLWLWADVRELQIQVRALGEGRSEITARAPLSHSRRLHLWIGGGMAAVAGGVGALSGTAIGAILAGLLGLGPPGRVVMIALVVALGFAAGVGAAAGGMRAMYRWGRAKGGHALQKLLQAVGVDLQTGGVFQAPPHVHPPGSPPPVIPPSPSSPSPSAPTPPPEST